MHVVFLRICNTEVGREQECLLPIILFITPAGLMIKCSTGQPTSVSVMLSIWVLYRGAKTLLLSFNGAFERGITDAVLGTN